MKEFTEEINAAIKKLLPQELGEELKKVLDDNKRMKVVIEELNADIKRRDADILSVALSTDDLKSEIEELQSKVKSDEYLKNERSALNAFDIELSQRQMMLELEIAKMQLIESEKRNDLSKEYVGLIFNSPVYTKHISKLDRFNTRQEYDYNTNISKTIREKEGEDIIITET